MHKRRIVVKVLAEMLLLSVALVAALGGSTPARAQLAGNPLTGSPLTVEPEGLSVTLPQGEEAVHVVRLTNTGSEPLAFCLSFERPLQRTSQRETGKARLRLSEEALGTACGPLGEILFEVFNGVGTPVGDPFGLTMTPEGRLFSADNNGGLTYELTPTLEVVRSFEHPFEDELDHAPATKGVTFNPHTGTLWWLNVEERISTGLYRALLLEGDLDGEPTGRRIELPITGGDPPEDISPTTLSYDPASRRYYFSDGLTSKLWAVDSLGAVVPGYPVEQEAYPGASAAGPDAHGGASGEPEAVRVELAVNPGPGFDRLVVVDPQGRDLQAETPLPDVSGGSGFGSISGNPLRSRLDPGGVLYFPFVNFDTEGIVGIRPHPLPPSWLAVEAWDGTLGPGDSVEITLTFRPGQRSVGEYTSSLQVFEAATGEAVEVPLVLEVTQGTDAEDGVPEPEEEAQLSVYPNPSPGRVTVALALPAPAEARVVVYDVLGRRVVVLNEGPLAAGLHRLALDGRALPAGLYLVRAEAGAVRLAKPLSVVR